MLFCVFILAIINFYDILCYFSSLYPIGSCFFLIHLQDGTKAYRPESQIVMDVPTAWAFFGARPDDTLQKVGEVTRNLVRRWNEDYCDKVNICFDTDVLCVRMRDPDCQLSFDQQFFQLFRTVRNARTTQSTANYPITFLKKKKLEVEWARRSPSTLNWC